METALILIVWLLGILITAPAFWIAVFLIKRLTEDRRHQ
jgi:hypothetical protein